MDACLLQKRYDIVLAEAQFLRGRVRHLELELGALRHAAYKADVKIDLLNRANKTLGIENLQLGQNSTTSPKTSCSRPLPSPQNPRPFPRP